MAIGRKQRSFSLHAYISTLFLALLCVFAAVTIATQYLQTKSMLLLSASQLFDRVGEQARSEFQGIVRPARLTAELMARTRLINAKSEADRLGFVPLMAQALGGLRAIAAIYVGYDDGQFFAIRPIDPNSSWGRSIRPPKNAFYLVQSISRDAEGLISGRYFFFDRNLVQVAVRDVPNYLYDPRGRPWYTLAKKSDVATRTNPYLFFTTRQVGVTTSQRSMDGHAVVGVDVTLDTLSDVLRQRRPTPSSHLMIVNATNDVIANTELDSPLLIDEMGEPRFPKVADLHRPVLDKIASFDKDWRPTTYDLDIDGENWRGLMTPLATSGEPIFLVVTAPDRELVADAGRIRNDMLFVAIATFLIAIPVALAFSKLISQSLAKLTAEAQEIRALRFDKPFEGRSFLLEIDRLALAMASMKTTISRLLAIGGVLGSERRFDRLLDRIVEETVHVADGRGGIVYLTEPDGTLKGGLSRWDGKQDDRAPPDLDPQQDADHPAMLALAGKSLRTKMTPDDLRRWYPRLEHEQPLITLTIPLKNRQNDVVGVLMLSQEVDTENAATEAEVMALVEAVSGAAAVAIETNRLIEEQKRLLQGIIELVAGAIDSKSPYTGGHCQRVPALTEMLAHAAADATDGVFKDFDLTDEQWEELHIAGWLHDCGKVTSPEYVIDKATKLETIYDRLHEVRMRFEVIKREAEVTCWRQIAEAGLQGAERDKLLADLQKLWTELDDEFAFIATSNVGGEFMAPDRIERVKKIAARRWTRTLDDRIGLSHEETERKARYPAQPLPASEPLLADRPEHILPRRPRDQIAADNPWGFQMKVPENLYNRGEIYNLMIARGTLTDEERFKINEHMIETIRMLVRLPLPRHLRNVPEIAGGHHEKMDGTGYPKRLRRDEMSIPARMMAVADIFEALTAADRPYKKAKTLSESIGIMAKMRDDAHIDPDLFELFLTSGVYQTYAERFLNPEQVDQIVIAKYLKAG